ncbi:MAG: hypothetical protein QW270_05020 [Candidatus Bathyarchaeia archaeon]
MEQDILDGREASLRVKKYFEEVHGVFRVVAFDVEDVSYDENEQAWTIVCNFFDGLLAAYKIRYKVKVDAKDGRILDVKQLELKK